MGEENVCILLLEEMRELNFWEDLVAFIDAREVNAEELFKINTRNKKNRRKIDRITWGLRPFDLQEKAKDDIHKIKQLMSGFGLNGGWVDKIVGRLIQMRIKYLSATGYKDKHLHDSEITLSSELRSIIRNVYKKPNSLLSDILGKNVSELGY
ncbi:hypothetical protein [Rhodohalobacter sp.]|uniref:hypothetical protein n=1 Tax=Rhodohalobacter sp. TaxID=1974210 RepID=UPI002ACD883B|nr:hypothetical protein [Rhodohalobacter sp.]MDZ7755197.1 hypothetical protein [Rhodohalobacter sp.]